MPTKRKTSLRIVCFYSLFLITSCVNSKKNKVTFEIQNEKSQAEVVVLSRTDTSISIELTCVDLSKKINLKNVRLTCLNPNPIGVNSVKILDYTEDDTPVQIYNGELEGNYIRVILPYGNLDKKTSFLDLKVTAANKANVAMKLAKK